MASRLSQVTLDVRDVELMSRFWAAVFGYVAVIGDDGCATLPHVALRPRAAGGTGTESPPGPRMSDDDGPAPRGVSPT